MTPTDSPKTYVQTDGPVPEYLTAGKVYEATWCGSNRKGLSLYAITDDSGRAIQILTGGNCEHLPFGGYWWTLCDQHGNPLAEQKDAGAFEKAALLQRVTDVYTGVVLNHVEGETFPDDIAANCKAGLMWALKDQLSVSRGSGWATPISTFRTAKSAADYLYSNGVRARAGAEQESSNEDS